MVDIRGRDNYGSGHYRASRGARLHNGIDIICSMTDDIRAFRDGVVTKIGYPYSQNEYDGDPDDHAMRDKHNAKRELRYVQVTDVNGMDARYFYVAPTVAKGDTVTRGTLLGRAQGLAHIWPGMTEHYHFEVLTLVAGKKVFSDPEQYIEACKYESIG